MPYVRLAALFRLFDASERERRAASQLEDTSRADVFIRGVVDNRPLPAQLCAVRVRGINRCLTGCCGFVGPEVCLARDHVSLRPGRNHTGRTRACDKNASSGKNSRTGFRAQVCPPK